MSKNRIFRKNGIRWVMTGEGVIPTVEGTNHPVDAVMEAKQEKVEQKSQLRQEHEVHRQKVAEEKKKVKQRETIAESMEKLYLSLQDMK